MRDDAIRYAAIVASDTPSIESAIGVISSMMIRARRHDDFSSRAVLELHKIFDALDLMAGPEDSDWMPPGSTKAL